MEDRYHAGFMTEQPRWVKTLASVRERLLIYLVDVVPLIYLWLMVSYCWNVVVHHSESYFTFPWWVMLVVVIETAAVWENFGISFGMKLLGKRFVGVSGEPLRTKSRVVRFLAWHLSGLTLIGLFSVSDGRVWHDRVSGTTVVGVDEIERSQQPWYKMSWSVAALIVALISIVGAMLITEVDLHALFTQAGKTGPIWRAFLTPEWSLLGDGIQLLLVTIFMAFMATVFGVVVAVPMSFLAARNLAQGTIGHLIYTFVRVTISITRSIEPIIWAIIFLVWVRVGAFPGVLALMVHSVADLTKLYSERLESIDHGPVEAIEATGAGKLHVILYGIVPQIVNPYLSFTLYRWDINVRMATIIGIVGGGGIGQRLYQYTKLWRWSEAGLMMLLIMLVVWAMDYTSSRLRARLE